MKTEVTVLHRLTVTNGTNAISEGGTGNATEARNAGAPLKRRRGLHHR